MSAILSFNSVSSEYYTSWELLKVGGKPGIIGTIGREVKKIAIPSMVLWLHIVQIALVSIARQ